MLNRNFVFSLLLTVSSVFMVPSASLAANPVRGQDIEAMSQDFQNFADFHGVKVSSFKISMNMQAPSKLRAYAAASSCTATATVSIPGGTGVTLSATAPTCLEAIKMLKAAISAI